MEKVLSHIHYYFFLHVAMFFRLEKLCDAKLRKNRETPYISHVKNTNATPFHLIFLPQNAIFAFLFHNFHSLLLHCLRIVYANMKKALAINSQVLDF